MHFPDRWHLAEAAVLLPVFEAWLAFLGEDESRRGRGKYSQPQNVLVINPQLCLELGNAGHIEDFGQQVMVCYCRGTQEHTEQGAAHRDTRQVLEGEQHKRFSPCLWRAVAVEGLGILIIFCRVSRSACPRIWDMPGMQGTCMCRVTVRTEPSQGRDRSITPRCLSCSPLADHALCF